MKMKSTKRVISLLVVLTFMATYNNAFALDAPVLTVSTSGLDVSLSWTPVPDTSEYTLYYTPYPYNGPDTINNADMGMGTEFSTTLWNGAAFYVAITARSENEESVYSNIELVLIDDQQLDQTELVGLWEYNGPLGPGEHTCAVNQSTIIERTSDGTLEIFFQILEFDNELNRLKIIVTDIPVGTAPYGVGDTFFLSYELQSNNAEMVLNFNTSEYMIPYSGEEGRDYLLYQKIQ